MLFARFPLAARQHCCPCLPLPRLLFTKHEKQQEQQQSKRKENNKTKMKKSLQNDKGLLCHID
jgi:hypothetical protein